MIGDNYPVCDVCDAFMDSSSGSLTCHRCMAMKIPPPSSRERKKRMMDGRKRTDDNLRSVFG